MGPFSRLFREDKPDICPNCGNACSASDVYCPKCGKNLDELFDQLGAEAGVVPPAVQPTPHYIPPMRLGPLARPLIAGGTLWTMLFPVLYIVVWIFSAPSFFMGSSGFPGDSVFDSPIFRYFGLIWTAGCLTGLIQIALMVFYLAHILKNTAAAETARIVLGVGVFLLPFVAMPIYYWLYLRDRQPPAWALARPGRPARPVPSPSPVPAADTLSEQPGPTLAAEPQPSDSVPGPQTPSAPEPSPQALAPGLNQLLAGLQGDNYHTKLAAIRHVREHQINDAPIVEALRRLADSANDRYLRDTAKKTLTALPPSPLLADRPFGRNTGPTEPAAAALASPIQPSAAANDTHRPETKPLQERQTDSPPTHQGAEFTLRFVVTAKDLASLGLNKYFRSSMAAQQRIRVARYQNAGVAGVLTFLMTGAVIGGLDFIASPRPPSPELAIGLMITAALIVTGITFAITPGYLEKQYKKLATEMLVEKGPRASKGNEWTTLSLNAQGLFWNVGQEDRKAEWAAVADIDATSNYIYLTLDASNALFIPMTAFASIAQSEAFVRAAREYQEVHSTTARKD